MAEKTAFSEPLQPAPHVRCCANCIHGQVEHMQSLTRRAVVCYAFPPTPVVMPNGALTFRRPVLELTDRGCELGFERRRVQEQQNLPKNGQKVASEEG